MASARGGFGSGGPFSMSNMTVPDLYGGAPLGEQRGTLTAPWVSPPAGPVHEPSRQSRKQQKKHSKRRRKQWGGDRRKVSPMVPKPVSDNRVAMGRLAIIVTVAAW